MSAPPSTPSDGGRYTQVGKTRLSQYVHRRAAERHDRPELEL